MNNILLSNEIIVFLFAQSILFVLAFIGFFYSILIVKNWDYEKTTNKQYQLEKKSYLIILIIFFTLLTKIFLFPYFAYSLDNLSNIIPGAMCAAGVIKANEYGQTLLALKLIILFFIGIWLIINSLDLKEKTYPYTKKKFAFYIFIFLLISIEISLDFLYLSNISTKEPVLCCSVIFGENSIDKTLPFNLDTTKLLILFYLLYILTIFTNIQKQSFITLLTNALFLYIAYYSVTYFFSTYIYELPTHQCPFCMLQKGYFYMGYFVWGTLFLGTFFGISNFVIWKITNKSLDFAFKYSTIFNTIFMILCSFYVIRYYLINGVFL